MNFLAPLLQLSLSQVEYELWGLPRQLSLSKLVSKIVPFKRNQKQGTPKLPSNMQYVNEFSVAHRAREQRGIGHLAPGQCQWQRVSKGDRLDLER